MIEQKRKDAFDPARARRKLLLYTVALFLAVTLLVLAAIRLFGYETVFRTWNEARPWVTLVKWLGLGAIIYYWNEFIRWAAERWNMDDGYREYLLHLRWRVAAMLLVLELLFGQNLIGHLMAA